MLTTGPLRNREGLNMAYFKFIQVMLFHEMYLAHDKTKRSLRVPREQQLLVTKHRGIAWQWLRSLLLYETRIEMRRSW